MSTKQIEALKLALEALLSCSAGDYSTGHVIHPSFDVDAVNKAIEAIDALAEQPAQQQEPVAWMKDCADFWEHYTYISEASQENYKAEAQMWVEKLRTSPPASKPWVGLTDEEFEEIELGCRSTLFGKIEAMRKVEAKLREKNAPQQSKEDA